MGRIGRIHAEIFRSKVDKARLVAVVDVNEALAKAEAERLGVKWYTDYDKALEDPEVDAVVICTPTYLHKEMVVKAAEAGKHILCEKPLTVRSEESKECVAKAEKAGVKLQVAYMRRFDYAYQQAKKKIEEGEIGRPIMYIAIARDPAPPPGWAADTKLSGGIFLDMLSHDFDMARWLMSAEVRTVYVRGGNYIYEEVKEKGDLDVVAIEFTFEGDALGFIHGSRKSAFGYDLRTEVLGTEGTLYVGCSADTLFSIGTSRGITYYGLAWFFRRFYDAYVEEDKHFIDCIVEDKKPLVSGEDGLRAVQIAEACWESYREGKPVEVKYQ
ncbi:MAG: inositol 2-dehydrogenase [Thermoprotei archaeon]|nr:MAG: inositol 2-dehydrogenase [Thermoprotei archaeon]